MTSSISTDNKFNGISEKILTEISGHFLQNDSSGLFQNHLFGCLSLLELLDDGSAMMDGIKIHIHDPSDNLKSIDISNDFHLIGNVMGFWPDSIQPWEIPWKEEGKEAIEKDLYPQLWRSLFSLINDSNNMNDTCGAIEDFEEKCYNLYVERLGNSCPFVECIEKGECQRSLEHLADASELESKSEPKTKSKNTVSEKEMKLPHKFRHTARLKRAVTPIFKRKGFNKTYKNKIE